MQLLRGHWHFDSCFFLLLLLLLFDGDFFKWFEKLYSNYNSYRIKIYGILSFRWEVHSRNGQNYEHILFVANACANRRRIDSIGIDSRLMANGLCNLPVFCVCMCAAAVLCSYFPFFHFRWEIFANICHFGIFFTFLFFLVAEEEMEYSLYYMVKQIAYLLQL